MQEVGAKLSPDILLAVANYHEAWHCWLAINAALSILQIICSTATLNLIQSWLADIAYSVTTSKEEGTCFLRILLDVQLVI